MKASVAWIVVAAVALAACGEKSEPTATNGQAADASVSATPEPAPVAQAAGTAPASFTQCKVCHSVDPGKNMVGPSLAGVYDRKAATVADFAYSDALKNSGITWTDAALDTWLTNPAKDVPGNKMAFPGYADPAQRKEVIDYLKTL